MTSQNSPCTRVLVVDDEPDVRNYLSQVLDRLGYSPMIASGADEALAMVESEKADGLPTLAIVDVVLGAKSGVELAASLAQRCPDLRVLLTSGYADSVIAAQPRPGGERTYFLPKAFTLAQLQAALETMMAA